MECSSGFDSERSDPTAEYKTTHIQYLDQQLWPNRWGNKRFEIDSDEMAKTFWIELVLVKTSTWRGRAESSGKIKTGHGDGKERAEDNLKKELER